MNIYVLYLFAVAFLFEENYIVCHDHDHDQDFADAPSEESQKVSWLHFILLI